jgi:hypothetical protein
MLLFQYDAQKPADLLFIIDDQSCCVFSQVNLPSTPAGKFSPES